MNQTSNRSSTHNIGGECKQRGRNSALVLPCDGNSASCARRDSHATTRQGYAVTQNKVLVIMDYGILKKQAYSSTGGQRDSIPRVTDSEQEGIARLPDFVFRFHAARRSLGTAKRRYPTTVFGLTLCGKCGSDAIARNTRECCARHSNRSRFACPSVRTCSSHSFQRFDFQKAMKKPRPRKPRTGHPDFVVIRYVWVARATRPGTLIERFRLSPDPFLTLWLVVLGATLVGSFLAFEHQKKKACLRSMWHVSGSE